VKLMEIFHFIMKHALKMRSSKCGNLRSNFIYEHIVMEETLHVNVKLLLCINANHNSINYF
jgi:hypothetical protein